MSQHFLDSRESGRKGASPAVWVIQFSVVLMLLGGALGIWMYRRSGGDVGSGVPPEIAALHAQLERDGIATTVSLVRCEDSGVRTRSMFHTKDKDRRAFFVSWCTSREALANVTIDHMRRHHHESLRAANGLLLLEFPHDAWPVQDPEAQDIVRTFRTFRRFDTDALRGE